MAIQTKYNIEITIDDDTFNVVVSELGSVQQEEMNKYASELESVNADVQRAASLMNDIETNMELIGCVNLVDKAKLLWENKDLKKELVDLQKKIKEANPEKMLSNSIMHRLKLSISGDDKEKLMSVIRAKNIDPKKIVSLIGEQIAESQKKKQIA